MRTLNMAEEDVVDDDAKDSERVLELLDIQILELLPLYIRSCAPSTGSAIKIESATSCIMTYKGRKSTLLPMPSGSVWRLSSVP